MTLPKDAKEQATALMRIVMEFIDSLSPEQMEDLAAGRGHLTTVSVTPAESDEDQEVTP